MILSLLAPAKVNLSLEVLGRRTDGYHEIRSVIQTVGLYDRLLAEPAERLSLCAPGCPIPSESNLVVQAARQLRRAAGSRAGARLLLQKQIPISAGLGGGSSDAAAGLRVLQRLWSVELPVARLRALASRLGSDVPLFLTGGAAVVGGRGGSVERLPTARAGWFVLAVPPWKAQHKTARVFAELAPTEYSRGLATADLAADLRAGRAVRQERFVNDLLPAARRVFPRLAAFQEQLEALAGQPFFLSGAGPTLYRFCASQAEGRDCAWLVRSLGATAYVARPLFRMTAVRTLETRPGFVADCHCSEESQS